MANLFSVREYHSGWDRSRKRDVEQGITTKYDDRDGNASRTGRIAGQEQPVLVVQLGNPGRQCRSLAFRFPTHGGLLARNGTPSRRRRRSANGCHRRQFSVDNRRCHGTRRRQHHRKRLLRRMLKLVLLWVVGVVVMVRRQVILLLLLVRVLGRVTGGSITTSTRSTATTRRKVRINVR